MFHRVTSCPQLLANARTPYVRKMALALRSFSRPTQLETFTSAQFSIVFLLKFLSDASPATSNSLGGEASASCKAVKARTWSHRSLSGGRHLKTSMLGEKKIKVKSRMASHGVRTIYPSRLVRRCFRRRLRGDMMRSWAS